MASHRKKYRANGSPYYEIRVSQGRGKPYLTKAWDPPSGWSSRAIERKLKEVEAAFEQACRNGEILTRHDKEVQALAAEAAASKIPSVREYAETVFMPFKEIIFSENARANYQGCLSTWIYPEIGDTKLPDVTSSQIISLLAKVQAMGRAHSTAVKVYTVLSSLFKQAYLTDVIDRNPMDKVPRPKARKDEEIAETPPTYTADEIREIFEKLSREPLKWRAYLHLIASTGIRRGEACGLKWEYVDFSTSTITIAGNLCYTPSKGVYYDTTKGKRRRTVIVAPECMALLLELKASSHGLSDFVFTQDGSPLPMHPQSPTRYMKTIEKRYGIPDFHPHKLRHTFASISIEQGGQVTGVANALGHKDSSTTVRTYIHGSNKAQEQASHAVHNAIYGAINPENCNDR